jgi:hypothetical protein
MTVLDKFYEFLPVIMLFMICWLMDRVRRLDMDLRYLKHRMSQLDAKQQQADLQKRLDSRR